MNSFIYAKNILVSLFLLLPFFSMSQSDEIGWAIFNYPQNITINGAKYTYHYANGDEAETDSLLYEPTEYFKYFPKNHKLNELDTMDLVYQSRIVHKVYGKEIQYNKQHDYASFLSWNKGTEYLLITFKANDLFVEYCDSTIKSPNSIATVKRMNKVRSVIVKSKIKKIEKLSHNIEYNAESISTPPIVFELKIGDNYKILPILTLDAPKAFKKSYSLYKRLINNAKKGI